MSHHCCWSYRLAWGHRIATADDHRYSGCRKRELGLSGFNDCRIRSFTRRCRGSRTMSHCYCSLRRCSSEVLWVYQRCCKLASGCSCSERFGVLQAYFGCSMRIGSATAGAASKRAAVYYYCMKRAIAVCRKAAAVCCKKRRAAVCCKRATDTAVLVPRNTTG